MGLLWPRGRIQPWPCWTSYTWPWPIDPACLASSAKLPIFPQQCCPNWLSKNWLRGHLIPSCRSLIEILKRTDPNTEPRGKKETQLEVHHRRKEEVGRWETEEDMCFRQVSCMLELRTTERWQIQWDPAVGLVSAPLSDSPILRSNAGPSILISTDSIYFVWGEDSEFFCLFVPTITSGNVSLSMSEAPARPWNNPAKLLQWLQAQEDSATSHTSVFTLSSFLLKAIKPYPRLCAFMLGGLGTWKPISNRIDQSNCGNHTWQQFVSWVHFVIKCLQRVTDLAGPT